MAMVQKVERGIWNEAQAKAEFIRLTGIDPENFESENTDEALGEFLTALSESLETAARKKEEAELEELEADPVTVELDSSVTVERELTRAEKAAATRKANLAQKS